MKKILIVEDEIKMREFITIYIKSAGYECIEASDGAEALEKFDEKFSLVLLDLMLPKLDGYKVCKKLREICDVPIIILTAVDEELAQLKCYELGADDYLTKPFKSKILIAKIKRFIEKYKTNDSIVQFNNLKIDYLSMEVLVGNTKINLAPKEYNLLCYLAKNKDIVLSRDSILDYVWRDELDVGIRVVDNHIKKLRSKLGESGEHIKTIKSVGYVFR